MPITLSSGMDGVLQFITVLLIFVIVLAVTYFVTRWVGNYQKMQNSGNNVQIVESVRISPSAFVEILRVGNKYIAVAVSKENVTFLTELSGEELILHDDGSASALDFGSILDKVKKSNNIPAPSNGNQEDE